MTLTTYKWITIATVILLHCSFVLSGWNSWSEYTQCSRSCGGGVKYRERQCVVDRLDRPVCKGKTRTYKLCNTQECEGGQDFRAEQCEKYNRKPLDGILYDWRPYYGHGETCELLCFADGFPFFRKMADKVIDGTPCLESNKRVCVDGQCKRVGCDSKIGSHKVFDKCGICGGDNSTCTGTGDIYGIFSVRQLPPGYSTIVEIPGGARDIFITELAENKNSIVFWDSSGENFAIDKETRKLMPSVKLAGTHFNYMPEDKYNTYGRVQATGPTLRKVTVYAVNVGESNPGIRYSYRSSEIRPDSYSEIRPDQGEEEKVVTNSNTSDQKPFLKPGNIRISTSNVPSDRRNYGRTKVRVIDRRRQPTSLYDTKKFDWATDDDKENKQQFVYQNAIQVLGGNNSITDNVYDENENYKTENGPGSLDRTQSLDNFIANEIRYRENWETEENGRVELESRGSRTRSQVYQDQRFMWSYGQWTECSSKCGSGYQRRIVSCIDRERREAADEEYCDLELRPSNTQRCRSDNCQSDLSSSYVRWQVGQWGPCSRTCELGDQVQDVYCEAVFDNGSTTKVEDERCLNQYRDKPQYRRSCNDGVVCTQGHMWMFSKWSQCSVTCGQGVQQRSVTCRSKSEQRQLMTPSACNADIRPVSMRRCDMGSCPPERQRQRPDRRSDCRNTFYGCCPDGVTPARGVNLEGCSRTSIDQRLVYSVADQRLVRVGGRQILNCARMSEQDKEKTYILEWTKHGHTSPVYKQYRWRWESYRTSAPEINPNFNGRVRILGDTSLEISQARETDSGMYTCTLVIPISRSDSRRYSNQIFLDVRENIVITEDDSSSSNRINPSTSLLETCQQQPYQGTCRDFVVKWFYNSSSQVCERFWYGGCDGNANNFDDEDDCRRTCLQAAPQPDDDICKQPSVTGRCRARHIRWYYNSNRKECQQFTYGGCGGNQNRFRTLADCQRQCLAGTEALGDQHICRNSRFGCCPDGVTSARGNNNEGCPNACQATLYGCCDDDLTAAQGPNQEGCDEIEGSGEPCNMTAYGCCPDGVTAATGPAEEGCDIFIVDPQPEPDTDSDITVGGQDGREVSVLCQLAKNTGPCKNYTVMWYYNTRENQCERFWYGGCDGNTNRFKSEKECVTTCQNMIFRETALPVCEQPKEIGPCRAGLPRWFYNSRTRACEQFFYGGCQGNENNFDRQDLCERQCGVVRERPLTAKEVCAQPQEVGPCRASIQRFYYNAEAKRCEQFIYGGCGGNRNNFETEDACRQYCRAEVSQPRVTGRQPVCELTPDVGPCDRMQTKYFYDITTLSCKPFTYGGCLGNHNNFETQDKCLSYCALRPGRGRTDDCQLSQEAGSCRGNIRRYYYDAQQGRCFPFTYGGCQGNRNNFADEGSCMSACQDVRIERPVTRYPSRDKPGYCPMKDDGVVSTCTSECNVDYECTSNMKCCRNGCGGGVCTSPLADEPKRVSDVCSLGLQTPCSRGGSGPYYYYEKLSGQCREVPNRECNDNQNNFRSLAECEAYCGRERVCQPLTYESDIRCLAYMEHWTYNRETQACEMFVYGGCGGSANNFQSKEACDRKCLGQVETPVTRAPEPTSPGEVCAMAEDSGNCLAYIRNWRYDSLTGRCVQFTYGGCGGNDNNFQSREECERFCNRQVVCQKNEDPEISCLAYMRRWRYEPSTRACENFIYGGCGGNANNFETVEACESKCVEREPEREDNNNRVSTWREICNLQADVGPCKQYIKKWHYSSISQSCEEFTYGGCLGNHNNFESREQCMTYCDSSRWYNRPEPVATTPEPTIDVSSGEIPTVKPATGVDVCHLESYTGQCRAYIRSWYYDSLNGECKQFIYGGCDTNGNKFDTQEACEAQCSSRAVCTLPKQAGNCFAYITRYYFDYSTRECKEFVYGGCDGNANNFETKEACERRCDPFIRDRPPVYEKRGSCPILRGLSRYGRCVRQCRSDRDCSGSKKCCVIACSHVCIEPETRGTRRPGVVKTGFCPPKTDWQGILGACAPTCQEDSSCPGNQKCCHHGCGLKCVEPVSEEPYQMNAPERVSANTLSSSTMYLHWYDPSLGPDQLIRDSRYYTIRFYSFGLGQYEYLNATELRTQVTGLRPDTEYEFNVRVNDPPYLSEWSENTRNRTASYSVVKTGQCPVIDSDTIGICVEECQNDGDCSGSQKCCSNGCGQTCINPQGYDICGLPKDPGSCSDWEVRWFFNAEIQRCDRFWYGGCNQGNANNFMDEIECQSKCTETQITTPPPRTPRPYDCRRTTYGCCLDRYTPRLDERGSNCAEYEGGGQTTDETVVPAIPGQSVTLTCRYTTDVAWYRDGKLVESSSRRRVNSDGTIEVYSATIEDDGMYACHVTDSNGRLTIYRYMLQVRVPIGILPGPDKIVVKPNHQAFLHCEVYGNPKPSVSWQKGLSDLRSDGRYETFSNGTLLIRRATEQDVDSYTCRADNGVSTPVQRTIKLELREMLVARIENDNGRVMEGGRIKLTCEGRGYPEPTITWEKMGRSLSTGQNVYITSDGQQLTIRDVTTRDTGTYSCIVSNTEEKIETSTSVQVVPKVMPDDKCEDKTSLMKCRLIVTARLCGYTMYSKICCASCRRHFNGE